ncbi:Branched-chain-amino-acid aminotransferase [Mycena kentingensis (nom. inval.)]|nr:Branched-chain-amino-acid aminotransferase [Mycena kentingensis (nom. inval.)]
MSLLRSLSRHRLAFAPGRFIQTQNAFPDPMTGELMSPTPDIQVKVQSRLVNHEPTHSSAASTANNTEFEPEDGAALTDTRIRAHTDHMLTVPWDAVGGWGVPEIKPYGPLQLEPSATVLHYAQTAFEGMKAYRDEAGKVTLFRPDMNMKRMNSSAKRLALPTFDGDALLDLIKHLIRIDKHWIPQEAGHSLYVRPTIIGNQKAIGVGPPNEALLFVIMSPVGPYYASGFKPIALHGTTEYIRAAPGGTGAYKLGINYASGVMPQKMVGALGYTQNLWLHGPEHELTEVGTMNMFIVFKSTDGNTLELVTPPLDGMILPGVTRDSVLTLAREHASGANTLPHLPANLVISERRVTMQEVKDAAREGRLVEMFGAGTAAVISPVNRIGYMGEDVHIPTGEDGMGPVSRPIWTELVGRQWGKIPSEWSVEV